MLQLSVVTLESFALARLPRCSSRARMSLKTDVLPPVEKNRRYSERSYLFRLLACSSMNKYGFHLFDCYERMCPAKSWTHV